MLDEIMHLIIFDKCHNHNGNKYLKLICAVFGSKSSRIDGAVGRDYISLLPFWFLTS